MSSNVVEFLIKIKNYTTPPQNYIYLSDTKEDVRVYFRDNYATIANMIRKNGNFPLISSLLVEINLNIIELEKKHYACRSAIIYKLEDKYADVNKDFEKLYASVPELGNPQKIVNFIISVDKLYFYDKMRYIDYIKSHLPNCLKYIQLPTLNHTRLPYKK